MPIILTKAKDCCKMSNFYPSSIPYLTHCVTNSVIKAWKCNLPEFSSRFLNTSSSRPILKKNMEKNFFKKNDDFLLTF